MCNLREDIPERKKGHREIRRNRRGHFDTSVIKVGLASFCKEPLLIHLIDKAVRVCSQVSWEANMLASFHVLRCLENDIQVQPLTQSFWDNCISTIANGSKNVHVPPTASQDFRDSYAAYAALRPSNYVPVVREGYMCHIFEGLRQSTLVNFETVFKETFLSRLCVWLRLKIMDSGRETLKDSKVVKSTVTLLRQACTNDTGSVALLHPKFTSLKHFDDDDLWWMQEVVEFVRKNIGGPLPVELFGAEIIPAYLPFMRHILGDIEAHNRDRGKESNRGNRAFSLLPQKQFRVPFIHVSTTVLKSLLKEIRGRARTNQDVYDATQAYVSYILDHGTDDELWKECFRVDTVSKGRKQFANSIKTDGISVSATVHIPRQGPPLPAKGLKRKLAVQAIEDKETTAMLENIMKACAGNLPERVIAIDPGVKAPVTGVVYDPKAVASLSEPHGTNHHFETVRWTSGKYYEECGFTARTKQMKKWSDAAPVIDVFNKTVASGKTASLETYSTRVRQALETLPDLLEFYVDKRRVRRLRWHTYMKTQQATEKMIAAITTTKTHADQKRVLVAYGDASMHNVHGTKPVVQKALHRRLRKRCLVLNIDEFRTSKLCCSCLLEMDGKWVEERIVKGKIVKAHKLLDVRHCQTSACHRTFWHRDVNAAINILMKCLRLIWGVEEPQEFRRPASTIITGES